jgi:integrase
VIGDLRVQEIACRDGSRAYTIVRPDGSVYSTPDRFLRGCSGGTDRTYAYLLVDHLRWLVQEGLSIEAVSFRDLERYMAAVGARVPGPYGQPWREGKRPYRDSALAAAAACLERFYLFQASLGVNREVARALDLSRLPSKADRQRMMLGHVASAMPANPLTPALPRRRHPKMPPEGAQEKLLDHLASARDRMLVTWLAHGGFRIGELCGLHLTDLHLRENAGCGECRTAHVHICHRETNANHIAEPQ